MSHNVTKSDVYMVRNFQFWVIFDWFWWLHSPFWSIFCLSNSSKWSQISVISLKWKLVLFLNNINQKYDKFNYIIVLIKRKFFLKEFLTVCISICKFLVIFIIKGFSRLLLKSIVGIVRHSWHSYKDSFQYLTSVA